MAAGLAMLRQLKSNPGIYETINRSGTLLADELRKQLSSAGVKGSVNQVGSMFTLFFSDKPVTDYDSAKGCDTKVFASYFQSMLRQGVYLAPSQFEAMFISTAINDQLINRILAASQTALREL
jgi:glutamate-1-semialdehyde 2,1-aminomutase